MLAVQLAEWVLGQLNSFDTECIFEGLKNRLIAKIANFGIKSS